MDNKKKIQREAVIITWKSGVKEVYLKSNPDLMDIIICEFDHIEDIEYTNIVSFVQ